MPGVPSVASSGEADATGMGWVDAIAETATCGSALDGWVPRALVLLAICPEDWPGASASEELRLLVRRKSSGPALPPVLAVVAIRANRARTIADAPTKAPGRGAPVQFRSTTRAGYMFLLRNFAASASMRAFSSAV